MKLACYALTARGMLAARRLAQGAHDLLLPVCPEVKSVTLFAPHRFLQGTAAWPEYGFDSLPQKLAENFRAFDGHVFFAASGIVVRCIAPLLHDKAHDPAVLVCDQQPRFVISLLSGHLGGANALSRSIAAFFDAQAVISTATDSEMLPAIDLLALENNCAVEDLREIRTINAALLARETILLADEEQRLQSLYNDKQTFFQTVSMAHALSSAPPAPLVPTVLVDWHVQPRRARCLRLVPRVLHLGMGCRKGTSSEDMLAALHCLLVEHGLAPAALASLASATLKESEPGVHELAAALHLPLFFYAAEDLAALPVPHPSPKATALFGVGEVGVCEAAALLTAQRTGKKARLLIPKQKYSNVTFAFALETP